MGRKERAQSSFGSQRWQVSDRMTTVDGPFQDVRRPAADARTPRGGGTMRQRGRELLQGLKSFEKGKIVSAREAVQLIRLGLGQLALAGTP